MTLLRSRILYPFMRVARGRLAGPTLVRAMTVPISFVCSLIVVRIILASRGVDDYASVALLLSLQSLFSLMDLGSGAAVINGAASFVASGRRDAVVTPLRTALMLAAIVSLGFLGVGIVFGQQGWWASLLGSPANSQLNTAVVAMLAVNILVRPTAQFQNALIGLGGARSVILSQIAVPLVNLAIVALAAWSNAPLVVYALGTMTGQLVAQACCAWLVLKSVPHLVSSLVSRWPGWIDFGAIRSIAGPMLAIAMIAPLATQIDRVILNHVSTAQSVAEYSLAMQFFQPLSALFITLQQALWADFARRRVSADEDLAIHVAKIQGVVVRIGLVGVAILTALVPPIAAVVSQGAVTVSVLLSLTLSLAFLVQLSQLTSSALFTTPTSLGYQSRCVFISVIVNLCFTTALAGVLGPVGPAIGTLIGSILLLILLVRQKSVFLSTQVTHT